MNAQNNENQPITLWKHNFHHTPTRAFLELALAKVDSPYHGKQWKAVLDAGRKDAFNALQQGEGIDIIVSAIGSNYYASVQRLPVPLDRGLLGMRLCLINPRHQVKFQQLRTLQDMQSNNIVFLQGAGWPDVDILRANGAAVKTFEKGADVVAMMQSDKPYCFSRSLAEIEQQLHEYPDLVLEQSIAIVYPLADIVYVSPKAKALGNALQTGLTKAVEDGSYFSLFEEVYGNAFEVYQFYERKLFFMQNPGLTIEERQLLNRYGVMSYLDAD